MRTIGEGDDQLLVVTFVLVKYYTFASWYKTPVFWQ